MQHNPIDYHTTLRAIVKAMFISHAVFLFQKQYLLFKVHCQSFAGMINQNSERSFIMCSQSFSFLINTGTKKTPKHYGKRQRNILIHSSINIRTILVSICHLNNISNVTLKSITYFLITVRVTSLLFVTLATVPLLILALLHKSPLSISLSIVNGRTQVP